VNFEKATKKKVVEGGGLEDIKSKLHKKFGWWARIGFVTREGNPKRKTSREGIFSKSKSRQRKAKTTRREISKKKNGRQRVEQRRRGKREIKEKLLQKGGRWGQKYVEEKRLWRVGENRTLWERVQGTGGSVKAG